MPHALIRNLSANAFGHAVHLASALLLVPLYIGTWRVDVYGAWLMLAALPTSLTTSADLGLTQVAGNAMTMRIAEARRDEAAMLLRTAWLSVTAASLFVASVLAGIGYAVGLHRLLGVTGLASTQADVVFACFVGILLLSVQQEMALAGLRAVGRFAHGMFVVHVSLLIELLVIAAALLMHATPPVVALLMIGTRAGAAVAALRLLRRHARWLWHGHAPRRLGGLSEMARPAAATLGMTTANAVMVQGLVVILGHALGPGAVVLFVTSRTLSRLVLQIVGLFSWAAWPEISRLYGSRRPDRLADILTHGTQIAIALAIAAAIVVLSGAPTAFRYWTHGQIAADRYLLALLMIAAMAATLRAFPDTIVVATNRHRGYGAQYLAICLLAGLASYPAALGLDVYGAAMVVAAAESVLMIVGMRHALRVIGAGATPLRRVVTTASPIRRLLQ